MPPRRQSLEDQPMDDSPSLLSDQGSWLSTSSAATPGAAIPALSSGGSPDNDSGGSPGLLRTLLPAPAAEEPARVERPARKKALTGRVQVAAACLACRKRKVKASRRVIIFAGLVAGSDIYQQVPGGWRGDVLSGLWRAGTVRS